MWRPSEQSEGKLEDAGNERSFQSQVREHEASILDHQHQHADAKWHSNDVAGKGPFSEIHVGMAIHDGGQMMRKRGHVILRRHGTCIFAFLGHGEDQWETIFLKVDTSRAPRSGPEVTDEGKKKRNRFVIDEVNATSETK